MIGVPNGSTGSSYRDVPVPEIVRGIHVGVTAALCWWDERVEDLEACVAGIAQVADRIVALDGVYRRFPGGTPASPPEQAEAIRRTAEAYGLDCLVITPDRLWAGQLEKRTYLYRMAALASDWVFVVDADHVISADRLMVRNELAQNGADVIAIPYNVPTNRDATVASKWHSDNAGITSDHNLLFRALPNLAVEGRHWWVSAVKDGRKVWVVHTDATGMGLPASKLRARCEVDHRYLFRTRKRVAANRKFLADRVKIVKLTDQEDDVPGLPKPAWAA